MTLYELSRLSDKEFDKAIESGAIHPKMERKDVLLDAQRPPAQHWVRESSARVSCDASLKTQQLGRPRKDAGVFLWEVPAWPNFLDRGIQQAHRDGGAQNT
jgi:hypothetical protein